MKLSNLSCCTKHPLCSECRSVHLRNLARKIVANRRITLRKLAEEIVANRP